MMVTTTIFVMVKHSILESVLNWMDKNKVDDDMNIFVTPDESLVTKSSNYCFKKMITHGKNEVPTVPYYLKPCLAQHAQEDYFVVFKEDAENTKSITAVGRLKDDEVDVDLQITMNPALENLATVLFNQMMEKTTPIANSPKEDDTPITNLMESIFGKPLTESPNLSQTRLFGSIKHPDYGIFFGNTEEGLLEMLIQKCDDEGCDLLARVAFDDKMVKAMRKIMKQYLIHFKPQRKLI